MDKFETKLLNSSQLFSKMHGNLVDWLNVRSYRKIIIVSPFVDPPMVRYLGQLFSDAPWKLYFFTREAQNYGSESVIDVLENGDAGKLANRFFVQVQDNDEDEKRYFHGKFLAGIRKYTVDLLVTSANFTSQHLVGTSPLSGGQCVNLDTLTSCKVNKAKFKRDYWLNLEDIPGWQHCFYDEEGYGCEPMHRFPQI